MVENSSQLKFEQLRFFHEDKKNDLIKAVFLKHYSFTFNLSELKLKDVKISENSISSKDSEKSLNNTFSKILNKGFQSLTNNITKRRTIYIHKNSDIPLIGTNTFGIVDRNTNCIEIKPLTGCNLNCIYCSVDEGNIDETGKKFDFLVEKDYLVSEIVRLAGLKHKTEQGLEIHIGPQGEPLLYPEITGLIKDISNIDGIKRISMDTNGLLLSEKFADELVDAGLTRFNISLNSMNKVLCDKISNRKYNLDRLVKMIKYIEDNHASSGRCEIIIAPVLLSGLNDSDKELDNLINFAKKLSGLKSGIKIGIQNFLEYKNGRNPVKQKSWEEFYDILKKMEEKHGIKLILDADDFNIVKNDVLKKPFKKDDIIKAEIVCQGSYPDEKIGASNNRAITIHDCKQAHGPIRLRIVRDKHNVFDAVTTK